MLTYLRTCSPSPSLSSQAKLEQQKAVELTSRLMGPLESMHKELAAKVKGNAREQARLAHLLNETQRLLEQNKYAQDWKAQEQAANEAAGVGVSGTTKVDVWNTVHKPSSLSAFCGTLIGLGGLAFGDAYVRSVSFSDQHLSLFVGSFGALSALFFGAPAAPLGRPWPTLAGHTVVVALAIALRYFALLIGSVTGYILPVVLEKVLAPALGIAAMIKLEIPIHPPAAGDIKIRTPCPRPATAPSRWSTSSTEPRLFLTPSSPALTVPSPPLCPLAPACPLAHCMAPSACVVIYATLTDQKEKAPGFLLTPVLLGCAWMLLVQVVIANAVRFSSQLGERLNAGLIAPEQGAKAEASEALLQQAKAAATEQSVLRTLSSVPEQSNGQQNGTYVPPKAPSAWAKLR